jgi:pilus assembly protein CpaE
MRSLVVSPKLLDPLSSKLRGVACALLDNQGPAAASYDDFEVVAAQHQPELGLVILSPDPDRGLEVLNKLRRDMNGALVAVGPVSEPKLILRALYGGADHYLDENDLEGGLDSILPRLRPKEESAPMGRLLAVLASSGGSGASTLAVNIATVLAKEHLRCALVDLKSGKGDLSALLDLKPPFNLADLCLNIARMDRAMFEKMLAKHSSGVYLLSSPQIFADCRVISSAGVEQALTMARRLFPYVVADLEDCFHEEQVVTLRQASGIFLVSRLDFTSLRNARRILEHLKELEIPRNRVRVVINRFGQPNELPVPEAETALGEKLAHFIPDDPKTFNGANNVGMPAVLKYPNAKVSQSILQLAKVAFERRRESATANGVGS